MQHLTNLNCSLTHWNSIQSSSELLISQQNLLPNLPLLEHLSRHRRRFPLSRQQYLEKIHTALSSCFSLSSYTTQKLLSTRKQPTFPCGIRKEITSHKSSWTKQPSSPTSSSALKHGAFVQVQQALGIRSRRTLHADLVVYIQLEIPFLITCSWRTKSQPSASSYQCSQHQTLPVSKTFPSHWYGVQGSFGLHLTSWEES